MTDIEASHGVSEEIGEEIPEPLTDVLDSLREEVSRANERIGELEDTVDELESENEDLRGEVNDLKQHNGKEHANINARITELEETVESIEEPDSSDETPRVEGEKTGLQNDETPLYRICALPEHIVERELTANQERARFIARDIRDYSENCPAGLVIDSRNIKKVLTASEGKKPHTQTVARVMDFLDDLGKDDVELKKRRGRKLVVFDPDAADEYHDCCDQGNGSTTDQGVIQPG